MSISIIKTKMDTKPAPENWVMKNGTHHLVALEKTQILRGSRSLKSNLSMRWRRNTVWTCPQGQWLRLISSMSPPFLVSCFLVLLQLLFQVDDLHLQLHVFLLLFSYQLFSLFLLFFRSSIYSCFVFCCPLQLLYLVFELIDFLILFLQLWL